MAYILNIDTSTTVCSVCLADKGHTIAERNDLSGNKHAAALTTMISDVLARAGIAAKELAAVAISSGPGSYTGLRIGTAVAKGICYAAGVPLVAVPTLQGMAYTMAARQKDKNGIYIPMLDARRNDVYMAIYDGDNNIIEKDTFTTINDDIAAIASKYTVKKIYFAGTGVLNADNARLLKTFGIIIENLICVASNINIISYKRYAQDMTEEVAYFEPFYLKNFEGRMNIN